MRRVLLLILKPLALSGSRGVIRADDRGSFARAAARIRDFLTKTSDPAGTPVHILVEEFIPGCEVALEGLLENGRLKVLALFTTRYRRPRPAPGTAWCVTRFSKHRERTPRVREIRSLFPLFRFE